MLWEGLDWQNSLTAPLVVSDGSHHSVVRAVLTQSLARCRSQSKAGVYDAGFWGPNGLMPPRKDRPRASGLFDDVSSSALGGA